MKKIKNSQNNPLKYILIIGVFVALLFSRVPQNMIKNMSRDKNALCTRSKPYSMPPEFERALSIIIQRNYQNPGDGAQNYAKNLESVKNCLSLEYADTGDTEGYFVFDKSYSKSNYYPILVSNKYQYTDDLSTAFLLTHELAHVFQYINEYFNNIKTDCYDAEVNAFFNQFVFFRILNDEEQRTFTSKVENIFTEDVNSQIYIFKKLAIFSYESCKACKMQYPDLNNNCWISNFLSYIEDMVKSEPYYQKQCNSN